MTKRAFTPEQAEDILDRWCAGGETLRQIGEEYGKRPETVFDVILRARKAGDPRAIHKPAGVRKGSPAPHGGNTAHRYGLPRRVALARGLVPFIGAE